MHRAELLVLAKALLLPDRARLQVVDLCVTGSESAAHRFQDVDGQEEQQQAVASQQEAHHCARPESCAYRLASALSAGVS